MLILMWATVGRSSLTFFWLTVNPPQMRHRDRHILFISYLILVCLKYNTHPSVYLRFIEREKTSQEKWLLLFKRLFSSFFYSTTSTGSPNSSRDTGISLPCDSRSFCMFRAGVLR